MLWQDRPDKRVKESWEEGQSGGHYRFHRESDRDTDIY